MEEKMTFILNAEEMRLLDACRAFEPWIEEHLHGAIGKQQRGRFFLMLEASETTDILNALGALSDDATDLNQPDKAIAFAVLHDKIKDVSRKRDYACVCEAIVREGLATYRVER
jgi:hypothetical protein